MRHPSRRDLRSRRVLPAHPVLPVLRGRLGLPDHRDHPVLPGDPARRGRRGHLRVRQGRAHRPEPAGHEDARVHPGHPEVPAAYPAVPADPRPCRGLPGPRGVPVAAVDPLAAPRGAGALAVGPADVEEC